jgi:hypothetical protein
MLMLSGGEQYDVKALCRDYRWKYCTDIGGDDAERHKLFYTCEVRRLRTQGMGDCGEHRLPLPDEILDYIWPCGHRPFSDPVLGQLRDFIAKVNCAYIDGRQRIFGGLVYDHERRFPVHAAHPQDTGLDANSRFVQDERT